MTYTIENRENTLVVGIAGEIDHHSALIIRQAVDEKILRDRPKELVLDFSKVDLMDSSGFGFVMGRYKAMLAVGGVVYVVGCKPRIDRLLSMSGAGKFVKIMKEVQK